MSWMLNALRSAVAPRPNPAPEEPAAAPALAVAEPPPVIAPPVSPPVEELASQAEDESEEDVTLVAEEEELTLAPEEEELRLPATQVVRFLEPSDEPTTAEPTTTELSQPAVETPQSAPESEPASEPQSLADERPGSDEVPELESLLEAVLQLEDAARQRIAPERFAGREPAAEAPEVERRPLPIIEFVPISVCSHPEVLEPLTADDYASAEVVASSRDDAGPETLLISFSPSQWEEPAVHAEPAAEAPALETCILEEPVVLEPVVLEPAVEEQLVELPVADIPSYDVPPSAPFEPEAEQTEETAAPLAESATEQAPPAVLEQFPEPVLESAIVPAVELPGEPIIQVPKSVAPQPATEPISEAAQAPVAVAASVPAAHAPLHPKYDSGPRLAVDYRFREIADRAKRAPSPLEVELARLLADPEQGPPLRRAAHSILLQIPTGASRVLLLTGTDDEPDTSHVAGALAMLLATEENARTLLVDAQPAARNLSRGFGEEERPGLSEALRGAEAASEVVIPTATDRLSIAPYGNGPPETTAGPWETLLMDFRRHHNFVVVDARPDIARHLAPLADAIFLVIHRGHTDGDEAARIVQDLRVAGGRVLGCVLTT